MANIRSAAKRARQTIKKNERNNRVKSRVKSAIKKFISSVEAKKADEASVAFLNVTKTLQKAASRKVLPEGRASRKISRLAKFAKANLPEALKAPKGGAKAESKSAQ